MDDYVAIAGEIRSLSDKPIIIEPNAGQPEIIDGRIVYDRPANEMAAEVWRLMMAGANIIGGCCGTTPEHISLFREAVKGHSRVGTNPGLPSK
jgi:methionine synthase I (cobalamin-dependent)